MNLILAPHKKDRLIRFVNHYQPVVKKQFEPLFSNTEIKFFHYVRFNKERIWQGLSTHRDFLIRNIEEEYFISRFSQHNFDTYCDGYFFIKDKPSNAKETKQIEELESQYKIGNLFQIVKKHQNHCDLFIFGTDVNCNFTNYYLNNIKNLDKICSIFKKNIIDIINIDKEFYVKIPKIMPLKNPYSHINFNNDLMDVFYEVYLNYQFNKKISIKLTTREKQCLTLLLNNFSAKKIANILDISPRTVEYHFSNIKGKFFAHSKKEIIDYYNNIV